MKGKCRLGKQICAIGISVLMILASMGKFSCYISRVEAEEGTFGVGQGKQIPEHVFAPFVDIVSWVSDSEYASSGSLSLKKMYQDTGILYYNLGFIMTDTSNPGITDGILNWSWGGYSTLSEGAADTWQLDGIKESIKYIRSVGGDVVISIGGLNEGNFFQATQDEEILYNSYMNVVKGYGLTRLDLDIEGNAQDKSINIPNAKALKKVQEETGVEIVLTLPVLPSGLTDRALGVLEAYLENGVEIKMVNIMAMCYGNGTLLEGENYGTASLRAVTSLADQLKNIYADIAGTALTDEEIYAKIGTTVSIGFESAAHPVWTTEWSELVVEQAKELNLGMTSFWCLNRDCMQYGENSGITGMYEHTEIFKTFMQGENEYKIPEGSIDGGNETEDGIKEWSQSAVYTQGVQVKYDGKIWEAQWWTQGTVPGTADSSGSYVWKYVSDADGENENGNQSGNENGNGNESGNESENSQGATDENKTPTGFYPEWIVGVAYVSGDIVSYEDKVYECISAHTSHEGWKPNNTSTLWRERDDLVNISDGAGESGTETPDKGNTEETGGNETETPDKGNTEETGENETETPDKGNTEETGGNETETPDKGNTEETGENETENPDKENIGVSESDENHKPNGGENEPASGEGTYKPDSEGTQVSTNVNIEQTIQAATEIGEVFNADTFVYEITEISGNVLNVQLVKPLDKNYTQIIIPSIVKYQEKIYTVTSIADNAFKDNKKLKKVAIGKNVTSIGKNAFSGCIKMTSVTIGKNVTMIKAKAFYNCKMLAKVTFKGNKVKKVGSKAFIKTNKNLKIKAGNKKTVDKYKNLLKKKIPSTARIVK